MPESAFETGRRLGQKRAFDFPALGKGLLTALRGPRGLAGLGSAVAGLGTLAALKRPELDPQAPQPWLGSGGRLSGLTQAGLGLGAAGLGALGAARGFVAKGFGHDLAASLFNNNVRTRLMPALLEGRLGDGKQYAANAARLVLGGGNRVHGLADQVGDAAQGVGQFGAALGGLGLAHDAARPGGLFRPQLPDQLVPQQ